MAAAGLPSSSGHHYAHIVRITALACPGAVVAAQGLRLSATDVMYWRSDLLQMTSAGPFAADSGQRFAEDPSVERGDMWADGSWTSLRDPCRCRRPFRFLEFSGRAE